MIKQLLFLALSGTLLVSGGGAVYLHQKRGLSALSVRLGGPSLTSGTAADDPARPSSAGWLIVCTGRVEAIDGEIDVAAQIAGRLTEVRVQEGDLVQPGDILAVLDGAREAAEATIAEAGVEVARNTLRRLQAGTGPEEIDQARFEVRSAAARLAYEAGRLKRDQALFQKRMLAADDYEAQVRRVEQMEWQLAAAQKSYETQKRGPLPAEITVARSELAVAEARLRRAQIENEYRVVRSPIAGIVAAVHRHAGDSVSIAQPSPIVRLVDTTRLRIRLEVDEMDVPKLRAGLEGSFKVRGDEAGENRLVVRTILPTFGPKRLFNPDTSARLDTRVLNVLCEPTDRPSSLYSGQRVTASFATGEVLARARPD